jgi:hypothetical protein
MRAPDDTPSARRARNDRQRRWRVRAAAGEAVAPVPYNAEIVNLLVHLAWLPEAEASDHRAVGKAISALLRDTARASKLL